MLLPRASNPTTRPTQLWLYQQAAAPKRGNLMAARITNEQRKIVVSLLEQGFDRDTIAARRRDARPGFGSGGTLDHGHV